MRMFASDAAHRFPVPTVPGSFAVPSVAPNAGSAGGHSYDLLVTALRFIESTNPAAWSVTGLGGRFMATDAFSSCGGTSDGTWSV